VLDTPFSITKTGYCLAQVRVEPVLLGVLLMTLRITLTQINPTGEIVALGYARSPWPG
jgi:hypothetical protein